MMVTDKWLTLEELSDYVKISLSKLYKMARNGDIPASRIGVQWRFDREEIDHWMKAQTQLTFNRSRGDMNNGKESDT
ncbi:MAG: helix-turn-helix domain-containing protein [Thiohalomonadales bacterium]